MKNLLKLGIALNKAEQKMIKGGIFAAGRFCCEWCRDGSCKDWVDSIDTPCPFVETC